MTRTLGIGTPEPSVAKVPLQRRDWLILCSDGLNDELEDREIAEVLRTHPQLEKATEALIDAALAKGGRDNVSAVVVEYDGPDAVEVSSGMSQKLKADVTYYRRNGGGHAGGGPVVVVLWSLSPTQS